MFLLLAVLILTVTPSISSRGRREKCDVFPKDLYIEEGSSAEIVCKTSCVHGKIYWTLDSRPINSSQYYANDSSHTILLLRNYVPSATVATLQCHCENTGRVVGGTTIKTYARPSNLSCIFHYDDDLFTCNWEHRSDPSVKINYTVLCTSCSTQSINCRSQKNTCTAQYKDIHDITFQGSYSVTVEAESAAWKTSSDPFNFTLLEILKIAQPQLYSVIPSYDGLMVKWKIRNPVESDGYDYHCQLNYSKVVSEGTTATPEWELSETVTNIWNMAIKKVDFCSNYTLAVRCRLNEAPWSDWSPEKTVLTKLERSYFKPHLWRKVAEAEENGVRQVRVMWMEIPSTCQDTFTYAVRQTPYEEHAAGVNITAAFCDKSVCDVNQDAHRINLQVLHDGTLLAEDSVYVPGNTESVPEVTDIQTSSLGGVIHLSWLAPDWHIHGYMIDYTHNGIQYYWKETKYTNATLLDLLDKTPYNITVTPLFDDKTGHGKQANQICSGFGGPGKVLIRGQTLDRSAEVSWTVDSQGACSGAVVNYTVFFETPTGPLRNVTVDYTTRVITFDDLTPGTLYRVYVTATALTGTSSSKELVLHTETFDPRLSTALIICGLLLIFLVLSLGLCCAVQCRKFKEKLVPNPGASSVASWLSTSRNMGMCSNPQFIEPSESICDLVYTEDTQRTPTSPQAKSCDERPATDPTEEYVDPAVVPALDTRTEEPVEPVDALPSPPPGESTQLLSSGSSPSSPYRTQSPVEIPTPRTSKQSKWVQVKQQEKAPPISVYVSLDMFEKGQAR